MSHLSNKLIGQKVSQTCTLEIYYTVDRNPKNICI